MTILFQPVVQASETAAMSGALRVHGAFYGFGADGAQMDGGFVLLGQLLGEAADGQLVVNLPSSLDGMLVLGGAAKGSSVETGELGGAMRLTGGVLGSGMAVMEGGFTLSGEAVDAPLGNSALLTAWPEMASYGGIQFAATGSEFAAGSGASPTPTAVVVATAILAEARRGMFDGSERMADAVAVQDGAAFVVQMLADDGVVFGDLATATAQRVARAVSRLLAAGAVSTYAEATKSVADALVLGELAWALQLGQVDETLLLSDHADGLMQFIARVLEQLQLADEVVPGYTLTVVLADDVVLSQALNGQVDLVAAVHESVGLCMTLTLDGGDYVAWTVNTGSKGATTYTNYPFNSFAQVGGQWYAACATGVYALGGDTDDGQDIAARLRLGMSSLGTRLLKRMADAFIGYTSDGTLLLRVITSDERTGEKVAAVYKLAERPALAKRENRFRIGRGLKSVDWDFELENMDGADFALDQIQFAPLVLSRRTRG